MKNANNYGDNAASRKRSAGATHRTMGKKSGAQTGLDSGIAEVRSHRAGQGVEIDSKSERPKSAKNGSIAMS